MQARLAARVLRAFREHALARAGDRLAVALSGGPDSVALAWLLKGLAETNDLPAPLIGLIHVEHGLRGAEGARDAAFCRRLAERLGLPLEVGHFDVAALARQRRRSIEATARDVRYRFFSEAAARLGATLVATGHTLDDQAETVLLRLLRGAGSGGLSGIRVRRGPFVRPVLHCRRADLRRWLEARGEPYCEDSSNLSLTLARNRVRHRLLPVIEELAPRGVEALARFAALAAADHAYFEAIVSEAAPSVVLSTGSGVQLDRGRLREFPPAVGIRVVRRALELLGPASGFSTKHLEAVSRLAHAARPSARLNLPGVTAQCRGEVVTLTPAAPEGERRRVAFDLVLPVPGRADVPAANLWLTAAAESGQAVADSVAAPDTAVLQAATLELPLRVRSRRPGDRLRPLGAPGRRKLQDVLVDRKVPRGERDHVPIVVDARGRIVWVAGLMIADECRVSSPSAGVVILKLHRGT